MNIEMQCTVDSTYNCLGKLKFKLKLKLKFKLKLKYVTFDCWIWYLEKSEQSLRHWDFFWNSEKDTYERWIYISRENCYKQDSFDLETAEILTIEKLQRKSWDGSQIRMYVTEFGELLR